MAQRKQKAVAAYHDRIAHRYDHIYDDPYWRWHDSLTWGYLKPHLPVNQNSPVIDLGCGTGKWAIKIARSGYRVTCVDISAKMLDAVQRKAIESGIEDKITCIQADLMDLSAVGEQSFELAVAFGEPLCSTDQPLKALKAIRGKIRPDGLLTATVDNRLNGIDYFLDRSDIDGLDQFLKNGKTHWLTKASSDQFALHTFTPEQTTSLLLKAGFQPIELLGKTVLPMRKFRPLFADPALGQRLLAMERKLARRPDAIGRAAHIQFLARNPGS